MSSICPQLKKQYEELKELREELHDHLKDDKNINIAFQTKDRIQNILEVFRSELDPSKIFFDTIFQEKDGKYEVSQQIKNDLKGIFNKAEQKGIYEQEIYDRLDRLFPKIKKINEKIFYDFLRKLLIYEDVIFNELDLKKDEKFLQLIISVFLNKGLDNNGALDLSNNENKYCQEFINYSDHLFMHLAGGNIKLKKAGNNLGIAMTGGTIVVERTDKQAGCLMTGGTIYLKQADSNVGFEMEGGTIVAEDIGYECGSYMTGGTIYADELELSDVPTRRKNIYFFRDEYISMDENGGKVKDKRISKEKHIDKFIQEEKGLIVIDEEQAKTNDYSEHLNQLKMKAGIVVFKTCPTKNIGENQTGGMIVIEDKKIIDFENKKLTKDDIDKAKETVLKRISENRTGGLIAIRIPVTGYVLTKDSKLEIILP